MQLAHEGGLRDQDEVVVFGEVFEEESKFAKAVHVHEMSVVDDGHEHLALMVEIPTCFDQEFFTASIASAGFDAKGLSEDVEGVGVSV